MLWSLGCTDILCNAGNAFVLFLPPGEILDDALLYLLDVLCLLRDIGCCWSLESHEEYGV